MREKALKALTKAAADGIGKMYDEGKCANLSDILDAREERVRRQQALIQAERQQFVALQQLDESQQSGSWRQFAGSQKPEAFSLIARSVFTHQLYIKHRGSSQKLLPVFVGL